MPRFKQLNNMNSNEQNFVNKEYFTVSELNHLIRDVINMGFPNSLWVCGEIQGYNRNKDKNHIFFELCEKDPQSKDIIAKIGLVIFSGRKAYIEGILKGAENAFELKDDIQVKFLCKIDFYPPHGAMRLIVDSIDPVYTLGLIAQQKQRLIALLKKKRILDKNKAYSLPFLPLRIGLITSYDSAAYNDFIAELGSSGFAFQVFYRNTLMQGKMAEADVCQALLELNRFDSLDVLVITRGGGSIAELSCFDSELIAEGIAQSRYPVLSGIGHEINITITDLASHTFLKTPTAVAQFLILRVNNSLLEMEQKAHTAINLSQQMIEYKKQRLRNLAGSLYSQTSTYLKTHEKNILRISEFIQRHPLRILKEIYRKTEDLPGVLSKTVKVRIKNNLSKIENFHRILEIANPRNTLKRGFSITRLQNGHAVGSIKEVKKGDAINTELWDGILKSQINSINKEA